MSETIFTVDEGDAGMQSAYDAARRSFMYFWRVTESQTQKSPNDQMMLSCIEIAA